METVTETPKRSIEEIRKDYANFCAQAGENNYRMEVLKQQITMAYQKISELSNEATALTKEGEAPSAL